MHLERRCEHTIDGVGVTVRCQLRAGHDGRHVAVAGTHNAGREVWRWSADSASVRRNPYQAEYAAELPWASGMPTVEHTFG